MNVRRGEKTGETKKKGRLLAYKFDQLIHSSSLPQLTVYTVCCMYTDALML